MKVTPFVNEILEYIEMGKGEDRLLAGGENERSTFKRITVAWLSPNTECELIKTVSSAIQISFVEAEQPALPAKQCDLEDGSCCI